MFNNIGGKIKMLAKIICWIGIIASAISAILIWVAGFKTISSYSSSYYGYGYSPEPNFLFILTGLLVLGIGFLLSWVGSFFTYGLGELIEASQQNQYYTTQIEKHINK
ncbi:MAG: hypothetical protein E7331_01220 [Clostridiales bacterium]|nr:hypothetical protein [Clostridiales bacterium]